MYILFSGGPALHGAVVVLGSCKLLKVPTGDTWILDLHKFNAVLFFLNSKWSNWQSAALFSFGMNLNMICSI